MSNNDKKIKNSRFPRSLFLIFITALLITAGLHFGLLYGMQSAGFSPLIMVHIILAYWALAALLLAVYTHHKIKKAYEVPMHRIADATARVAAGDFSVRIEPLNAPDKLDYLDVMIADFNKMVEELGSIETLRVDFFSNVSHEIKTPLAVIQNTAEMLERGVPDEERRREYITAISSASKRLSTLISNILRLNKLERQTIIPSPAEFDLCDQLVQSALMFETVWEERGIEFNADLADERRMITADSELLPLVWNNLLSNAFKFTERGGTVTLREYAENGQVCVIVEDTGCGMDEQTRKHIFDKFYQGDTSHSTEGNGLGLALAQRVIQLSGGTIDVESIPGKGTRFTVILKC